VLRALLTLAILAALVYAAATVRLGKYTLFGHIRAIWHTEEVHDLETGVKETAGPTVDKVKRGVEAGYKAMKHEGSGSAGSAHPATP